MKTACLFAAFLLISAVAQAQTPAAPATYVLKVYNQGATTPFQSTTAPATAVVCNLAPTPAGTAQMMVNPTKAEWDDPVNTGKVCQLDFSVFLGGLPANITNVATLSYIDTNGLANAESNPSNPFVRALPGAALGHFRLVGGK